MAKRMTEEEVVAMLRAKIDRNEVLFMPNCGCGLTAKLQEAGGADLICLSATSYWRMKGQGSLAPMMPYSDINQVIFDLAPEVVANINNAPILAQVGATNPLVSHTKLLDDLWNAGVSGINPFMMNIYGAEIMEQMQQIGMGWDKEADLIGEAHKKNMFALEYAFTPEEARILAENGCPCISSHVGSTVGGMKGAKSKLSLDDAVELTQEVFDAALSVNPDIILFAHGGPMKGPKEAEYEFIGFLSA